MSRAVVLAVSLVAAFGVSTRVDAAPVDPRRATRKAGPDKIPDLLRRAKKAADRRAVATDWEEADRRREAAKKKRAAENRLAAEKKKRIELAKLRTKERALRIYREWKAKRKIEQARRERWKKKKREVLSLRNWGIGIFLGGLVVGVIGGTMMVKSGMVDFMSDKPVNDGMWGGGIALYAVGFVGLIAGPVMWGVGNARLSRIYREERKLKQSALLLPRTRMFSWRFKF